MMVTMEKIFVLLALIFLASHIDSQELDHICENAKATIKCPCGQKIKIFSGFYGRKQNIRVCARTDSRVCESQATENQSLNKIKSLCENKNSCEITASNGVFGDPCVGIKKYVEVEYQCIQTVSHSICEWPANQRTQTITCPAGRVIKVTEGFYGRSETNVCGNEQNTNCRSSASENRIKEACDGQNSCTLTASNEFFSNDPCQGTQKYIQLQYHCEHEFVGKRVIFVSKNQQEMSIGKNRNNLARLTKQKTSLVMMKGINGRRGTVSFQLEDNRFLVTQNSPVNKNVQFRFNDGSNRFKQRASFILKKDLYFPGFVAIQPYEDKGYLLATNGNNNILKVLQASSNPTNSYKNRASFLNIEDCKTDEDTQRISGTCNNLNKPVYGSTNQDFLRLCDEGSNIQCNSLAALKRPGAQTVCEALFKLDNDDRDDGSYTALLTYWGQFFDHDVTLTVHPENDCLAGISPVPNLAGVCSISACFSQTLDQCPITKENIDVNKNTPVACYPFTKSQEHGRLNAITSLADFSSVYGSDKARSDSLRSFSGGKLKVTKSGTVCQGETLLPDDCAHPGQYLAGDVRANENPILLALHTIFVKEHNRIAEKYAEAYSNRCPGSVLSDEKLFQAARKINIAQMQNIVLHEYLPELGFGDLENYDILKYDSKCNPGIFQEFSTAAYRFGHSAVKNKFTFGSNQTKIPLQQLFFNTDIFRQYCPKGVLENQWKIRSELIDNIFSQSIGEKLFDKDQSLCALNVQRGRDHKLGSYKCLLHQALQAHKDNVNLNGKNIATIKTINDLRDIDLISQETLDNLIKLYGNGASLDQMDIFAMGLVEKKWTSIQRMGVTFDYVLRKQFINLIKCDRFFFIHCNENDAKCIAKREEIRKRKFSDVMCNNLNGLEKVKKKVFSLSNDERSCGEVKEIRKINFDLWLDDEQCL